MRFEFILVIAFIVGLLLGLPWAEGSATELSGDASLMPRKYLSSVSSDRGFPSSAMPPRLLEEDSSSEPQTQRPYRQKTGEEDLVEAIERQLEHEVKATLSEVIHALRKEDEEGNVEEATAEPEDEERHTSSCDKVLEGDLGISIEMAALRLLEMVTDFSNYWLNESWGVISWDELDRIFPEKNDCILVIRGLPCLQASQDPPVGVANLMKENLNHALSYSVALESIFLDEAMHERRSQFLYPFSAILQQLKYLAASLMEFLDLCGEVPDKELLRKLTSEIHKPEFLSIGRKIRGTAFLRQLERGTRQIIMVIHFYNQLTISDHRGGFESKL